MTTIVGSATRAVFVRANIVPLFPEALPPARGAPLQRQAIRFPVSDLCASESDVLYEPYNQLGGSRKSFHLSEYFFSSNVKKLFFDINLFTTHRSRTSGTRVCGQAACPKHRTMPSRMKRCALQIKRPLPARRIFLFRTATSIPARCACTVPIS